MGMACQSNTTAATGAYVYVTVQIIAMWMQSCLVCLPTQQKLGGTQASKSTPGMSQGQTHLLHMQHSR
jgi:hypothetical protein